MSAPPLTEPSRDAAYAMITDITAHALNAAHQATTPIVTLLPAPSMPSPMLSIGLSYIVKMAEITAALSARNADVVEDPKSPAAVAMVHAVGHAMRLYPDLDAIAREVAAAHSRLPNVRGVA